MRQGATWIISAVKTFPILTYHALIMAWLALAVQIVWINLKQQHFTSGYITYLMGNPMNPMHGMRPLIGVMRMHCVMSTHIVKTKSTIHLYIYRWILGTPPMLFYKRQLMTSQKMK